MATCGPKLTALLRTRGFYSTAELVMQFKAHLLGVVESRTAGLYHAATSVLAPLDNLYNRFVREVGLNAEQAFLQYNLAPLCLRRDVAMLGLLHKCALGLAHPRLCEVFPLQAEKTRRYETRKTTHAHCRQLLNRTRGPHSELLRRSALGLARVYNDLPAAVVAHDTVKGFQRALTALAKEHCAAGAWNWTRCFSPRPHVDAEQVVG